MGFCYNCGSHVDEGSLFCSECGCRLNDDVDEKCGIKSECIDGYIFTNLSALSRKLSTKVDILKSLFEQYISIRRQCGISYTLIDASNYSPKLKINRGLLPLSIKLKPEDGWQAHQRMLMDRFFYDIESQKKTVEYLFIIGSDDVIPMPAIGQHSSRETPSPILSDIPYSHLYGDETEGYINDNTIYEKEQMLYVGRLPLADDATIDMLATYLKNAAQVSLEGINPSCAYGQCDPHWKAVTSFVAKELYENDMFYDYSALTDEFAYGSLMLTPFITKDNVDRVFNPNAQIYLFNMHGSEHPKDYDYHGAEVLSNGKNGTFYSGITPQQFQEIRELNIVVAEPCFGAKPNKRKYDESILLSSLVTKTVLFFGSTHVAWGALDPRQSSANEPIKICCADIMAREIIRVMRLGYPAGLALLVGRISNFGSVGFTPSVIDTCLEFNLFGDPSLTLYGMEPPEDGQKAKTNTHAKMESKKIFPNRSGNEMRTTIVFNRNNQSILSMVRNAVDRHSKEIQEKIAKHLYGYFNIVPRQLDRIVKVGYTKEADIYNYHYADDDIQYVVTVDNNHNIKSVISSK